MNPRTSTTKRTLVSKVRQNAFFNAKTEPKLKFVQKAEYLNECENNRI